MLLKHNLIVIFVIAEITGGYCRRRFTCPKYRPLKSNYLTFKGRISEKKCQEYHRAMFDRILQENYDKTCKRLYSIVRGKPAKITEFPHMGALGWKSLDDKWIYRCGCSLISHSFVLTAAHCTKTRRDVVKIASPEIVRLGTTNIYNPDVNITGETPVIKKIKRIIRHPNYASPRKYYDIALIELKDEVTFTKFVQAACLVVDSDIKLTQLIATGWGAVGEKKHHLDDLQTTVIDVLSFENCSNKLMNNRAYLNRNFPRLKKHQMCAGKMDGSTDTCQGDSGGPLQGKLTKYNPDGNMHVIVGITSFGYGCGRKNIPGIYTSISYFTDWIEQIVWPDNSKMVFFPNN